MMVHKPGPELLATISPANYLTLRILQTQGQLSESLDRLRPLWQPTTVIHGDVKSDNVLVCPPGQPNPSGPSSLGRKGGDGPPDDPAPATGEATSLEAAHRGHPSPSGGGVAPTDGGETVRLVDWELAQRGDPAWDLAGVFQDAVLFWISGMNLAAGDPAAMAATAGFPWDVLRAYLRAVWLGYKQSAGLGPDDADVVLTRAVAFSGVRLVQTAYEVAQVSNVMPAQAVLLLQVSANLLADPESAQVQFYGIPHSFRVPL
jgi:hypothetical protein